jgi:hypothetical protein
VLALEQKEMKHLVILFGLFLLGGCASEEGTNNQQAKATPTKNTGAPSQELTLIVEDYEVGQGEEICIDVKVKGFNQIMSMQYTMNWDPTALEFVRIDNIQLEDLTTAGFGTNRTQQGKLGTAWYDMDVQSVTLPDGQSLYQVCYKGVGKPATESRIFFSGDPVTIEVSNKDGEVIGMASRRATIRIK